MNRILMDVGNCFVHNPATNPAFGLFRSRCGYEVNGGAAMVYGSVFLLAGAVATYCALYLIKEKQLGSWTAPPWELIAFVGLVAMFLLLIGFVFIFNGLFSA